MSSSNYSSNQSNSAKRNLPSWMNSKEEETARASTKSNRSSELSSSSGSNFSKLLDGVVFVLSGFVNPERSTLRSQALEMGGEYRPDWGPDCTLLICAYSNTPKFRQVENNCGTIVSKPDPGEINNIATEGMLTCIQDAIDTLEQQEDVRQVTEQWGFIPRLVEELVRLDNLGEGGSKLSRKKELHKQAITCKRVYEKVLKNLHQDSVRNSKNARSSQNERNDKGKAKHNYDSDETIEMTEEEIDLAYRTVTLKC